MGVKAISAQELYAKLETGILILDVRNQEDFQDWKIEGNTLKSINIPYFDFLDENEELFAQIPKEDEIVVICAKGGSALMVAEMLDVRGYRASYLELGMLEWSQFYHPITVADEKSFKLIQINRQAKGCLSYMIFSDGQALVVDPGRHIKEYEQLAEKEQVKITHIIDTHLHADHISGGHELAENIGAAYYISAEEMKESALSYEPVEQHQQLKIGSVEVKVLTIPTPGHTPGSVSVLVNNQYLLSGDTIFVGGLGRPDLGGKAREWAQSLYDTVFTTIASLSDDVIVLPTHYADHSEINEQGYVGARLGEIRQNNEVMRMTNREQFTEMVAGTTGATPPNYEQIVQINRGTLLVDADTATEMEIGPNNCAIHHA